MKGRKEPRFSQRLTTFLKKKQQTYSFKKNTNTLGNKLRRATKLVDGYKILNNKERLKRLDLPSIA